MIEADSATDADEAEEKAAKYRKHTGKRAELEKTESAGDKVIIYFNCK
ncbi:MAG: hypothetical protein GY792_11055 [Gammaproteobacteria bacterium]|nr:hypothetical protein [Gammaproteobacteria bacterium]